MIIETTLNMHVKILEKIEFASKRLNKSRMYIIRMLLAKMIEDDKKLKRMWSPVKYQDRDMSGNWHVFHLTLRQDEYEYGLDLRKIYRMSLSAVVAYTVDKYLDEIVLKFSKLDDEAITDNYLYKNYIIAYRLVEGVHSWRIYWGYTHKDLFRPTGGNIHANSI